MHVQLVSRLAGRRAWIALGAAAAVGLSVLAYDAAALGQVRRPSVIFKTSVAEARRAMSKRDLDAASTALKRAKDNAGSDEEKDEVERLESIHDYLVQFWRLLAKGADEMEAGTEFDVGAARSRKTKVAFVEAVAGGITLRVEGRNRLFLWRTMPTELVLALAEESLAKDKVSDVVLGAFLAMDEKGDRDEARRLWEQAVRAGLDVEHLLAELDSGAAGGKEPIPTDAARITAAEEAIKQEYRRLYARSGIKSYQEQLARKLLTEGPGVTDDPVRRYVMLRDARDLAAAAGDLRMAGSAIEKLAEFYEADMVKLKLEMLEKAAEGAKGPQEFRDVVLLCLNLADEAHKARRTGDAQAALKIAGDAARNSKSRTLMQQVVAAEQYLKSGRRR